MCQAEITLVRWPNSYRYLTRLHTVPTQAERLHVETVLSGARIVLTVLSLAAVMMDPTEPTVYARTVYIFLTLWLCYSVLALVWIRFRGASEPARITMHIIDIVLPSLIMLFTHGPSSPFFVLFIFAHIGAAFRWGFPETMLTSIGGVALLDLEAMFLTATSKPFHELLGGEFEINRLIIRSAYLLAIGYLVGVLGENEKERRAESSVIARVLNAARPEHGMAATLQAAFAEYIRIFRADRVFVVTQDLATDRVFIWNSQAAGAPDVRPTVSEMPRQSETYLLRNRPRTFYVAQMPNGDIASASIVADGGYSESLGTETIPDIPFYSGTVRSLIGSSYELGHEWSVRLIIVNGDPGRNAEKELRFLDLLFRQSMSAAYSVYLVRRLRARVGAMERARVARELHDGAIQSLISAEMRVDVLRRRAERDMPSIGTELDEIQTLLRGEVLNLRELMQQMKPVELGPQQLLDHMADLVDRFRRDTGMIARFVSDHSGEVNISPRTCRELLRIVQEGLANVRKHARAGSVIVAFDDEDGYWKLTIADDGRGFDFSGYMSFRDLLGSTKGPAIIKERVHGIGGELNIDSHPGHGTRLEIKLPKKGHTSHGQ